MRMYEIPFTISHTVLMLPIRDPHDQYYFHKNLWSNDYIPPFVPCIDIPVCFYSLFHGKEFINNR